MPVGAFPPDKDLDPGDVTVGVLLAHDRSPLDGTSFVQALRARYEEESPGQVCDIVMLAVPAGKGDAFLDGLGEAMA